MKTKLLIFLLASGLLGIAAWLVHVPDRAEAEDVPEKYRDTVQKGLEYLAKNQHKDGHWEGDGGKHPVAMTGLVGLALLMERKIERYGGTGLGAMIRVGEAKYSANITKAVDWLMAQSQPKRDGLIFSEHPSETARYMQGHGLATLFLAGVRQGEGDAARHKKVLDVLTRAVKYIGKAQSSQGGWYNTSKVEGHDLAAIEATVIQIQALQAAENVGIPVPDGAIRAAQEYLKMAMEKYQKVAKAGQNRGRQADTAAVLAARYEGSRGLAQDKLWQEWLKYCQAEIPAGHDIKLGRDELIHYYFAEAAFKFGDETWAKYRTATFDHLKSSQNKDGGWPAADGLGVGQVYSTAVWCTVLQLDKNSHPSSSREPPFGITTRRPETGPVWRLAMKFVGEPEL